jgi:hypothetical protein
MQKRQNIIDIADLTGLTKLIVNTAAITDKMANR